MKCNFQLFSILLLSILFLSCEKETDVRTAYVADFRIVNVVTGGGTAKLNNLATNIANNPSTVGPLTTGSSFFLEPGNPNIYVWPSTDSLSPYYNANGSVTVTADESYFLVIGGTPASPASVLVKESWQNYTDSVVGIRFVNMSPNSTPVNVTLSTSTTTNQFSNVAFKDITDFKQFPATSNVTNYTFQVRRASSPNTVLSSFSISVATGTSAIPRFKNVTIVFRGNIGGSPAPGITRVNHY